MKKTFQRILCIFFAALTAVSALGAAADSAVDSKIENTIHNIGFMLLMLLMIYVTFNDVFRIIK